MYLSPRAADTARPAGPFLGADGVATLLLSLLVVAATLGLSLALAFRQVARMARHAPAEAAPGLACWAVVLGTRPEGDAPGPVFRTRLDRARALAAADPGLQVAVLGGVTRPGAPPEGLVGTQYLREAGLCPRRLVAETRSRHTLENLREFRAALPAGEIDPRPVLLVTSRTHLARALRMAAGLGLAAVPCAAEAPGSLRRAWRRLSVEAFLLHWYVVGSRFAHLTRSRRMLARIA